MLAHIWNIRFLVLQPTSVCFPRQYRSHTMRQPEGNYYMGCKNLLVPVLVSLWAMSGIIRVVAKVGCTPSDPQPMTWLLYCYCWHDLMYLFRCSKGTHSLSHQLSASNKTLLYLTFFWYPEFWTKTNNLNPRIWSNNNIYCTIHEKSVCSTL